MAKPDTQPTLFSTDAIAEDTIVINDRCSVRTVDEYRVVLVAGIPMLHWTVGDRTAEAHAMVMLVEHGWADQNDVARAFGCAPRTLRRHQQRYDEGGLALLGRSGGYPKGRARAPALDRRVHRLKAAGWSHRQIAQRLGVAENAVRKRLRRLGWRAPTPEQMPLHLPDPPPPVDDTTMRHAPEGAHPNLSASADVPVEKPSAPVAEDAHPNLSAFSGPAVEPEPVETTFDRDPSDRSGDRLLAYMGWLDDAAPLFRDGTDVPGAGVLLALPALVHSGVFAAAREVYGSIGPAFFGLRTTILTLLFMALLRIQRPEALKERSPAGLGRLLGLDRAPEVKTVRRKLTRLAALGAAADFGRRLAERRVAVRGQALGFLYVDGHVRVYYGKRRIPKTHAARLHFVLPATTDYWVNDQAGDPLFVVTAEANAGLVKMLPELLGDVRAFIGDRRVTVVFDRGGWSPKLFAQLIADKFDILTYRKGKCRRVPPRCFSEHKSTFDGRKVRYQLADQNVALLYGSRPHRTRLRLRQVTRLRDDHQTPVLTSRRDLPAIEVAYRMFERWRQENFFGYLKQEYLLDALVDYQVEPADPTRTVPNPARTKADAKLHKAREALAKREQQYGLASLVHAERKPHTSMRSLQIANRTIAREVWTALERARDLERRRKRIPARVPVREVTGGPVIQLATERKHLSNLLKMVAYQAESDLVRAFAPHYPRNDDEGRTLAQNALASAGDIEATDTELRVTLAAMSSPHRTRAIAALCEQMNATNTVFPGTRLRLRYAVAEPADAWA